MNFLQISLTSKCNFTCSYCPMADYRNTDDPTYHLTNEVLLPYLEQWVDPKQWVVELTGGEPTLYNGIDDLLAWLSVKGYRVIVKSNGSNPIPHLSNVKQVSAFHKLDDPPHYYDEILIIDTLDSEAKIAWCEANGAKYKVIGYGKDNPDGATHSFKLSAFIEPTCHQLGCQAKRVEVDIQTRGGVDVDVNRLEYRPLLAMPCCKNCKPAIDAWRFLEAVWKLEMY